MRKLLLSILLFLFLAQVYSDRVQAQEQLFEIRDFKGLNTVAGDFAIQPNQARVAHNIDFGRNVGSITKRYGYDSISTITGMDSIVAIYGAYYSDGTQQLFVVADSNGTGYGAVYAVDKGEASLDTADMTKIWDYWSVFGHPSFTMVNDDIYIVNGYSRGIVYSNGIARSYPPKAPGEPTIVPLDDFGGLNGEYRYVFYVGDTTSGASAITVDTTIDSTCYYCAKYDILDNCASWAIDIDCSSYDSVAYDTTIDSTLSNTVRYQSVVSDKIIVRNGKVLLTDFQFPNTDSVFTSYPNGVRITITRTEANIGRLTPETKIYYVTDFLVPGADSAKRYVYVDTSSDATIKGLYASLDVAIDIDRDGRDSTGAIAYRYGSPRFIIQDTIDGGGDTVTYDSASNVNNAYGIFHGMNNQKDTLGYAYVCTFIDTVTGIESDTGRSLFVWLKTSQRSGQKPFYNTISLPRLTADDSGIVLNLYRSEIKQITYDTAYWVLRDISGLDATEINNLVQWYIQEFGNNRIRVDLSNRSLEYWKDDLSIDTVVSNEYYLLGQYTVNDTIVTDSIRQDSLAYKRLYTKSTSPDIMTFIQSYQGRLYGVQGSRAWRSGLLNTSVDTIQSWGQMDFQDLNASDGDIGTVIFPTQRALRFMKYFSSFNIYDDFGKTEISNTIGCVAPNSYASGTGGHYYLSDVGVIYETDGQQLERTFNTNLVSQPLKNFDNYDITELQDAYGTYFDRKYMLTVQDTTYVYDERSGQWSTWSIKFGSSTKFGTETDVAFVPGDTLYFTLPGGSTIYRYGTSEYDNYRAGVDSTIIQFLWQSPPLFTDFREVSVNAIGMWCNSTTTGDSIGVDIRDEEGVNAGYTWYKNLSQRYFRNGVFTDKGKYFTFKIGTASNAVDIGSTYIDGLDIFYRVIGNTKIE